MGVVKTVGKKSYNECFIMLMVVDHMLNTIMVVGIYHKWFLSQWLQKYNAVFIYTFIFFSKETRQRLYVFVLDI